MNKVNKDSKYYLQRIDEEVENLKNNRIENSQIVYEQGQTIETISKSTEEINHNTKVSSWYLDLIRCIFGRLYEKFNKVPFKKKTLPAKTEDKTPNNITNEETNGVIDEYDKIINNLDNIQNIHKNISHEAKNQRQKLNTINNINLESENNIYRNDIKAKSILRKL